MIKVYIHRNIVSHALRFIPGTIVLAGYTLLAIMNKELIGIQASYNPLIPQDIVAFGGQVLILWIILLLFFKSYLAFFPSTRLTFGLDKVEFEDAFKKSQNLLWADIEKIDIDLADNRLLLLQIRRYNGETIECYMSHFWLLSVSKTWCVNHNFCRLMAIAGENQNLKSKLSIEQLQVLYSKVRIKGGVFR